MSKHHFETDFRKRYPVCSELLLDLEKYLEGNEALSEFLYRHPEWCHSHPFLLDIARIEEARHLLLTSSSSLPETVTHPVVNPALELLPVTWMHLPEFLSDRSVIPEPGEGYVLVLIRPGKKSIEVRNAEARDLLALKILTDDIEPRKAAAKGGVAVGAIDNVAPLSDCETIFDNLPHRDKLTVRIYENAHHSFDNSTIPAEMQGRFGTMGYNEAAAKSAWKEVTNFLRK